MNSLVQAPPHSNSAEPASGRAALLHHVAARSDSISLSAAGSSQNSSFPSSQQDAESNGIPRLTGKKRGVDSFNIYVRLEGETTWRLLVAKRVRFPYDDESPVAHPGTPEEREYQIIGVLGDHEVGQPSDIATAVVPG